MREVRRHGEWLKRLVQPLVLLLGDAVWALSESGRGGKDAEEKRAERGKTHGGNRAGCVRAGP